MMLVILWLVAPAVGQSSPDRGDVASWLDPASPLAAIEQRIHEAMDRASKSQSSQELIQLRQSVQNVMNASPTYKRSAMYWDAYLAYQLTIHYLYVLDNEDRKRGKEEVERGINLLEGIDNKNSEEYALLSLLEGMSIEFVSGIKAGIISGKAKRNAQKAIDLNNKNPRAYYALGSLDYYTPKMYGGGKKAESLLLKSVSLPARSNTESDAPNWGRNYAYETLIRLYLEQKRVDLAKKYYQEAISLFPNDTEIKSLDKRIRKLEAGKA